MFLKMSVEAKYIANLFGPFYSRTKTKSVRYDLDTNSPTIKDLINKLIEEYPTTEEFFFDGENLAENTMIVINGDIVSGNEWMDTKITPEDRISFFQGQHGG
jgi:molybdopterin converting factor small subunit